MNFFFFITPAVLQRAIWIPTRLILSFFVHLTITNTTRSWLNDKHGQGIIFAANHTSELDAILVPAALPFWSRRLPVFYVSRPRAFYKNSGWRQRIYGGLLFKLWGAHPAIAGAHDYEQTLATHIHIVERGGSVLIFPEGKRSSNGEMGTEAHGGVAYLAARTGCPIVPVHIRGAYGITLTSFLLRRRRISLTFGVPTSFHLSPNLSYKQEAEKVLRAIMSL